MRTTTPLLHGVLPAASRSMMCTPSSRQGGGDGCQRGGRRRGRRRRLASEGKAETAGGGQGRRQRGGRRLGIYEWGIDAEREGGGLFVKYKECEGAFVKVRRVPKSSVACQMSHPQLFCMNLLQQTSWRASFVGFFSFCMKLFPPLQVYV